MNPVRSGIEVAIKEAFTFLENSSVGILCNQVSVDSNGEHLVDLLSSYQNCRLKRIFTPEHGFRGTAQDMEAVEDERQGDLEVVSLYGSGPESLSPDPEQLKGLDILVVDLPDIGTRYYTYSQTMAYCMQVADTTDTKLMVLDRPNPINGVTIEGSPLKSPYRSFCGIGPIANRHGMTLGELALLFQKGFGGGDEAIAPHSCDLEVIQVEGWQRELYLDETSIPWVKPSPNMPSLDAATVYPGTCLFEATNLSEGRGTDEAFLLLGAPFANGEDWLSALSELELPMEGVSIEPSTFIPKYQKHAGETCQGIRITVEDRTHLRSYRLGILLLVAAARAFPNEFQWRKDPYEFIKDVPAIDLLYGGSTLRDVIEGRSSLEQVFEELETFEDWYGEARQPFLIY
ncbi:DUF1343 domain-containing protein [Opitutia bacterium ISCC 51]|nr:DUF1343 domain-containing protein [Opitutae bacterium ISCC 51]QXD29207.1 DUF1343 domain-containing protein [Opitutae bacterium ISCC 52]